MKSEREREKERERERGSNTYDATPGILLRTHRHKSHTVDSNRVKRKTGRCCKQNTERLLSMDSG